MLEVFFLLANNEKEIPRREKWRNGQIISDRTKIRICIMLGLSSGFLLRSQSRYPLDNFYQIQILITLLKMLQAWNLRHAFVLSCIMMSQQLTITKPVVYYCYETLALREMVFKRVGEYLWIPRIGSFKKKKLEKQQIRNISGGMPLHTSVW